MFMKFQVSWIRKSDLHILTMGPIVYTNDQRVQSKHPPKSSDPIDWNLIINNSGLQDSGIYECQINTEPKKSKAYILQVVGEYRDKINLKKLTYSYPIEKS